MTEQRKEPRIPEETNVTVVIESAPGAPDLEGMVFPSSSVDISLQGMMIIVENPVPEGSLLELRIMFSHLTMDFWHQGVVIWDREWSGNETGGKPLHKIGIQFDSRNNPQFNSWHTTVDKIVERKLNAE